MSRTVMLLDKLSFVHIPKTAGLSLNSELAAYFGADKSLRVGDQEGRARFKSMTHEQLCFFNYIGGHFSVQELLDKGIRYPIISVVRDPLKRLLSLHNYINNSNLAQHEGVYYNDFHSFLEHSFNSGQLNMQCWHLSGHNNFEISLDCILANNIFVVPLEFYQDLIDTLSGLFGFELSNKRTNVTHYSILSDALDERRDLLDSIIGEDLKLFSHVKHNYKDLKQAFIRDLDL